MSHLKHIRVLAPLTVFLVIMTILVTARGALVRAASLVTASSTDPYATCSNTGQSGTNYVDAEEEPYVAVKAGNIVGVWQQDRWSNGGAHGLVAGFSTDGGATFGESQLPFSKCFTGTGVINDPFTGAPYDRASDPWVSIGHDGTAYAVGLLATETASGGAPNNDTGVAAVTSSDGGKTWGNPNLIKSDQGTTAIFEVTHFFNDKESVTADPIHDGTAYVVWDRLVAPSHSVDADLKSRAFQGPTWFSKTTDGGKTWTGTRAIFDPGQNAQTIGNLIVVDPRTGVLYDFFEMLKSIGPKHAFLTSDSVGFVSSSDGGTTWSGPTTVSAQQLATDKATNGALLRTGAGLPSVAIDASTGKLFVVWEDAKFTGGAVNQVVISTSTDGGKTWSAPAAISKTPTSTPAFTTTVAVNSAGNVAVTYYDMRNPDHNTTEVLPTDYWIVTSTDHGATFPNEARITSKSFDMSFAPNAGGLFLGDYEGLTNSGTTFEPFFVQTNMSTTNRTDVFAASI